MYRRIRLARQHAGMTQQQVADAMGVSKASVAQWESRDENQRTKPSIENLIRYSKLTGAPVWWLLSTEELTEDDLEAVPQEADYGALPLARTAAQFAGEEAITTLAPPPVTTAAMVVVAPDESMAPDVEPGDFLICGVFPPAQGQLCVAAVDGRLLVRRYRDTVDAQLLVAANSSVFPPLDASRAVRMSRVIELRRIPKNF